MGKVKTILTAALAAILAAGCFVGCKDPDDAVVLDGGVPVERRRFG